MHTSIQQRTTRRCNSSLASIRWRRLARQDRAIASVAQRSPPAHRRGTGAERIQREHAQPQEANRSPDRLVLVSRRAAACGTSKQGTFLLLCTLPARLESVSRSAPLGVSPRTVSGENRRWAVLP